ncbi:biliverdin-producing heme oxygenase [Sphingomonas sp. I4]
MKATRSAHDGLDNRIISAEPFQDRDHYVRLLEMQYRFHRAIHELYGKALPLPAALDLPGRGRLDRVRQDLADLGRSPPDDLLCRSTRPGWIPPRRSDGCGSPRDRHWARPHC